MSATPWQDWALWTLGALLAVAGVSLLYWSLFHDRARSRRRCPKCWYDMAGVPGLVCPECGRAVQSDRRLARTRRRWRLAAAAILLFPLGWGVASVPKARRDGWTSVVPGTVLVLLTPVGPESWKWWRNGSGPLVALPQGLLQQETVERIRELRLGNWQTRYFLRRFFAANPDQINHFISIRTQWPSGELIRGFVDVPSFIFEPMNLSPIVRVRVVGHNPTDLRWELSDISTIASESISYLSLPHADHVDFEIEYLVARTPDEAVKSEAAAAPPPVLMWRGTKRVEIGGERAAIMIPFASPEADLAVVRNLRPRLARDRDGNVVLRLSRCDSHVGGRGVNWALGARCEVLQGADVVATGEVVYPMRYGGSLSNSAGPMELDVPLKWRMPAPTKGDVLEPEWSIRLVGDPTIAFEDLSRTEYWAGDIVVPVTRIHNNHSGRGPG